MEKGFQVEMPRKTALPFPFIKTKNVLDDGIKEHCLQLSSLLSEQGSSSVYSKLSTNFFLQKEKKPSATEQSGCDVPMPEPFCLSFSSPQSD